MVTRQGRLQFKNGNFELDDLPHYGRSLEIDIDVLQQLIGEDPRLNTQCLAEQLGFSHTREETHLVNQAESRNMEFGYHISFNTGLTLVWN